MKYRRSRRTIRRKRTPYKKRYYKRRGLRVKPDGLIKEKITMVTNWEAYADSNSS